MNYQTRKTIHSLADKIRDVAFPSGPNFPVDPAILIEQLGGKLIENAQLSAYIDAEINKTGESFEIRLRHNQPKRRRFTLAHELGHLFLHMKYLSQEKWEFATQYQDSQFRRTLGDYSEEELQANEFAASFLMPESDFSQAIDRFRNKQSGEIDIIKVAEYFGVSEEAATLRAKWLRFLQW
jgi:Zn-dependent peptidase ImmA (M78 family)